MHKLLALSTAVILTLNSSNGHSADTQLDTIRATRFVDIVQIIPEVEVEIRYYSVFNFVGTRINGYKQPKCLLTIEAAHALKKVQQQLKKRSTSGAVVALYHYFLMVH